MLCNFTFWGAEEVFRLVHWTLRLCGVEGVFRLGTFYFCGVEGALRFETLHFCGVEGAFTL